MLKKWLENEPKVTLVCAVLSAVSLVLSIIGVLRDILPIDIAWIAIIMCGVPILIGAFRGVIFEHDIKADLLVSLGLIASAATGEFFAVGEVALIMQIASLVINISAVVLSALGILTPITGALWHNFGSVFVVVNAALLLRVKESP